MDIYIHDRRVRISQRIWNFVKANKNWNEGIGQHFITLLIGYLNTIYATEANFEFRFRSRDIHSKKWIFWLFKGVSPANVRGRISQEREWNQKIAPVA